MGYLPQRYRQCRDAGTLTLLTEGQPIVVMQNRFDPETGVGVGSVPAFVDLVEVRSSLASLREWVLDHEAFLADIEAARPDLAQS